MKWVRAAFIIVLFYIAAASFHTYTQYQDSNNKRQELLDSFNYQVYKSSDLLKDEYSHFNERGSINIPLRSEEPILKQSSIADTKRKENVNQIKLSNRLEKNYEVIGKIEISKIDLNYPIIGEVTNETLDISISRLCGKGVNSSGNLVLVGHNRKNGSMFGKLKDLVPGDSVKLYDSTGSMQTYTITKSYIVEPTDLKPLDQDTEGKKIITLITCSDKGKKRLVVKGIEE